MKINLNDYEILNIDEIKKESKDTIMYDIKVEDDNSFFISKNKIDNILVHNCDGSHISGLLLNFFDKYWPELLQLEFLYQFITPVVKATKKGKTQYFYNTYDYQKWKSKTEYSEWHLKWLKGLGTLEPFEIKLFFKDLNKHLIKFNSSDIIKERDMIDLAFNKKRVEDRKEWLLNYKSNVDFDKFKTKQTYDSFFNNEFIEFSMADNIRSIPSMIDGLKPSQRKILYTLLKKNFKNEIKVSQLCGDIISLSAYHNGSTSLEQAIISMSQNFIGSNNLNLLEPVGQFGSRLKGGKDASAPRYIFTKLNEITKYIFKSEDDDLLEYLIDDGYKIEPKNYIPIIPMILINNAEGIGTGWSTNIPSFNPTDVITYIQNYLKKSKKNIELIPWYNGFKGEIIPDLNNKRYISRGIFKKLGKNKLSILELPIMMWNDKYFEYLDKLIDEKYIKDYDNYCTDDSINIVITISEDILSELTDEMIIKKFNLDSYISINNMNLFNEEGKIYFYKDQYDIIDDFVKIRTNFYNLRKKNILYKFEEQKKYIINKMKFINCVLKKDIIFENKTKEKIISQIENNKIEMYKDSYDYLINISLISLSTEKLSELKDTYEKIKIEIDKILSTTETDMWLQELDSLKKKIK